jgi:hypothetical protein
MKSVGNSSILIRINMVVGEMSSGSHCSGWLNVTKDGRHGKLSSLAGGGFKGER